MIDSQITILIPTSITPSMPSTWLIDNAVRTIRHHLPTAHISICCDGLREDVDQKKMVQYSGYCETLGGRYDNASVHVFTEPVNQIGMLEYWLATVKTPLILYLEHDFEVKPDPIEWDMIAEKILDHTYNYIKISGTQRIPPEHEHLMHARKRYGPGDHTDFCVIETTQFSTWVHVASLDWYRKMYDAWLSGFRGQMIEPTLYGILDNAPWGYSRMAIYNPTQGEMMRTQHLDGARWMPK